MTDVLVAYSNHMHICCRVQSTFYNLALGASSAVIWASFLYEQPKVPQIIGRISFFEKTIQYTTTLTRATGYRRIYPNRVAIRLALPTDDLRSYCGDLHKKDFTP